MTIQPLGVPQVAAKLGVRKAVVEALIRAGELQARVVRCRAHDSEEHYLISLQSLADFLSKRDATPGERRMLKSYSYGLDDPIGAMTVWFNEYTDLKRWLTKMGATIHDD